jgi:tRNA-dihydrouridine synthase
VTIARIAEDAGIRSLAVHGRTRADHYRGAAEYDTIRAIKDAVRIPVFANGDIDSGPKARAVLEQTGADGVMIGRAAQGRPWIFREVRAFLATGRVPPPPSAAEVRDIMLSHLEHLYAFYGEHLGVRVARKHLGWYRDAALPVDTSDDDLSAELFRELRTVDQASAAVRAGARVVRGFATARSAESDAEDDRSEPGPERRPRRMPATDGRTPRSSRRRARAGGRGAPPEPRTTTGRR